MLKIDLTVEEELTMVTRTTTVTRKGQVTIPIDIRRSLDLKEGDRVAVEQQGEAVLLRRATSVAERTAGILARYQLAKPLSAEEERARFEQGVAGEVSGTDHE
jgi:antitoxin PrlF